MRQRPLDWYEAGVALHTDLKVSHRSEELQAAGMRVRDMNRTDRLDMERGVQKRQIQWNLSQAVHGIRGHLMSCGGYRYQQQLYFSELYS